MLRRREYLLGSLGAGLLALGGRALAADDAVLVALKQAVGARDKAAGMIAVVIDDTGSRTASWGRSGAPNGAMNGDTVFEIMSNTKVLTSLLLADMVERGEVAFDDPVARYLPVSLRERGGPITLLDLATYTSGLPNMPDNVPPNWYATPAPMAAYTQAQLFAFLSGYLPAYAPGTHYEYANLGFGLLGIALARRAGKPYEQLLVERICNPLGLADTRLTLSADMKRRMARGHDLEMKPTEPWELPAIAGAGYVRSTANDLTRFIRACLGLAPTPLDAALARMTATQRPTSLAGTKAGMGWYVTAAEGGEIVWKSGLSMGCNTFMGYCRQRRRGVVLLANFLWLPLDAGTIGMGVRLIDPDFRGADFNLLYPH
jgi:CubicO group peptidase (beta-lactamase class C family)